MKWKTEEQMQKELNERISFWKEGLSKDGFVERASGTFEYKGVKYIIKVLRYYNHTNRFTPMGTNKISDCHCVVECPKETKLIKEIVDNFDDYYDFLWHDTLYSCNDTQTIEQQIKECHSMAKRDINNIPRMVKKLEGKIKKMNKIVNGIKSLSTSTSKKEV